MEDLLAKLRAFVDPFEQLKQKAWGDKYCPRCGKKGHQHHPLCNCRECS